MTALFLAIGFALGGILGAILVLPLASIVRDVFRHFFDQAVQESLVIDQPALSKRERKRTLRYIDDFYKTVDSPRRVNDRLLEACLKS